MSGGKYTIAEAKKLDLVDYLAGENMKPKKIRGQKYWFLSPFREEDTPSFMVNRSRNRWRDYGEFTGIDRGNIIDFGIKYFKCTVADFLAKLGNDFFLQKPAIWQRPERISDEVKSKITIVTERPLTSKKLLEYLESRGISPALAKAWCCEVDYEFKGRTYYAIGFKNNSGGFEIRSEQYQLSSAPKNFTTIPVKSAKTVAVFEGFTDFLSYCALPGAKAMQPSSYLILNSLSFFETARPFLEQHETIRLYLDQDKSGIRCTQYALSLNSRYKDESKLYAGHKDLNEYLVALKKLPKVQLKQKPG